MALETKDAFAESVTDTSPDEKRREARYPCDDPAEVRILPGDGSRVPATVVDVSRSGMRLQLAIPVTKGSQIEIFLPKQVVIFGQVRHCKRSGDTYHAGVLIQEVFYSRVEDREHVEDDHLRMYLAGHGLTLPQVIGVRDHLAQCESCRRRMVDDYTQPVNPAKLAPPVAR